MGFEITYFVHPRKEDGGGYDYSIREEKSVKIGKPFEEIPLENLAAAVMAQMARRDVLVVDVQVVELVRKEVAFKECKDGQGIILKNRRFSFNEAAQMVAEDVIEECSNKNLAITSRQPHEMALQPHEVAVQPHEVAVNKSSNIDDLYSNPNKNVPVKRQVAPIQQVNQNKVLYRVLFDPSIHHLPELKSRRLKLTPEKEYAVHQIVPHPTGKLEYQQIVVTDDVGRPIKIDEKYFSAVGSGLIADKELGFSGSNKRRENKPKLSFENEMYIDLPDASNSPGIIDGVPIDDGNIPDELLKMPDIRGIR